MLTEEEKRFIEYWKENRQRKKRVMWQLAAGLPLGAAFGGGILINIFSGWFKGLRMDAGIGLTILIAVLLIVIFVVVFSAKHKWDQNEQRYQELLQQET